jgi:hypothetical protein
MSADRDVTRIVRSWLHEDAHEDADRVLDMVLDLVDTTPQRRPSWLARRTPTMNNYARLGLVAAAVLAVVIVGIGLFGRLPNVGPAPSPSPSFTASAPAAVNPLVGTWLAPEVTCAQQVATIEAAGYTADQITQARAQQVQDQEGFRSSVGPPAFMDPTCENIGYQVRNTDQWSLVFDGLPVAATIRSARTIDNDVFPSPLNYRVVDASTFELGSHNGKAWDSCLTLRYSIVGDQLTIHRIAPSCTGTADAGLVDQINLTAILETSSFTRQP